MLHQWKLDWIKCVASEGGYLRRNTKISFCMGDRQNKKYKDFVFHREFSLILRFAKNVSADSVNVSTLKGEGELNNLELNETVITDLLELPTWLRISRAQVNKVNLKIQWTKLKNVPILVTLDEVQLEMETCQELRSQTSSSPLPSYSSGGKYGFTDKVIDGMTVTVNSVLITFSSHAFHATFQLSRIVLDSKNPNWQKADLRMTRLKEPERGELLIFKELTWQTLRVEARSTKDHSLTPLRLITNQARCRITIKKKMHDCSVVACRLVLLMDDLLWVLTDSQLTAAFHFIDSLSDLVRKATQQSQKTKAIRKLESLPEFQAQQSQHARGAGMAAGGGGGQQRGGGSGSRANPPQSNITKVFNKYDVPETSHHFYSERIDLHFCDDPGPGRSSHPELSAGAALQVTISQLELDFYPYHLASGDRTHWVKYTDCTLSQWAQTTLAEFKTRLIDSLNCSRSSHTPLARAPPHISQESQQQSSTAGRMVPGAGDSSTMQGGSPHKGMVANQLRKLMSSCCVLRINDFCVYRVSTSKRKQAPKEFISAGQPKKHRKKSGKPTMCDKERFNMPTQTLSLHLEFTTYYYPFESEFPVPPPKLYMQLNPLQVTLDTLSILWLNSFVRSLQRAIVTETPTNSYLDVHLEAIMPRMIVEGVGEQSNQRDRPRAMHVQTSRLILSNVRSSDPTMPGSLASLATCLEAAQQGELFFASDFPSSPEDFQPICDKFVQHATAADNVRNPPLIEGSVYEAFSGMKRDALWTQARDVLFVYCDPLWVEFLGVPAVRNRPVPFVDAFPLSLWVYIKPKSSLSVTTEKQNTESCSEKSNSRPHRNLLRNFYSQDSSMKQDNYSLENTFNANKDESEKGGGSCRSEAALHVLAHTPSLVSVQLNHYQYLFLMRQVDVIAELTSYLTYDTIHILTHPNMAGVALSPDNLGDTIAVAAVIPQVDVSLVMPPPQPCKDSMAGDMESFLPDSSSTADLNDLGSPTCDVRNSTSDHSLVNRANEADACSITSDITKSFSVDHLPSQPSPNTNAITNQTSITTANGNIKQPIGNQHTSATSGKQQSPSSIVKHEARQLSSSLTNLPRSIASSHPRDTDPSYINGPMIQLGLQGNLNAGFHSMRKGLTSITNLIESAVVKTSPEDMSDTVSVRSDLSSDSDNFILINMDSERTDSGLGGMDALFRVDNKPPPTSVELASEVFEEATPSDISDITSSFRRKDTISVVTFKMSRMQVIQESRGYESVIKVQCCHLICEECSTMGYDEFQKRPGCNDGHKTKFSSRCRGWSDSMASTEPCCLKVRLETNLTPMASECEKPVGISGAPLPVLLTPFLKGQVADLSMAMLMSTVTGLVDLVEDEILPKPLPIKMEVERVRLRLTEDRIPANITSPGSVPTQLWIPKMVIERDMEGIFTILPQVEESDEVLKLKSERDRLSAELEEAKREIERLKGVGKNYSTLTLEGQVSSGDSSSKS
ncbi:bridge-like lipid transfer protein family member 3B isoform X3 [Macrobrachium nipponense]|uniref:bridge-like lipid transfer protein family member 3B isoform X3 n=1 Tax=Macrobrachium nipponense TaxID=159736 RepID=UPI0030C82315